MAKAAKRDGAAPEEIRDLRGAIEWMKKEGDILITEKEVDPNLEITGIQKQLDGSCPIVFENVKGKPKNRCITNLFGDMNVINKMFGWKDHADRTRKLAYALTHPIPPVVVDQKDAAVQEEVYEKPAEANEFVVPIRHTDVRARVDGGFRQPSDLWRILRRRYGPWLQPHELSLGQRWNFSNLSRLPYVAGGQQIL